MRYHADKLEQLVVLSNIVESIAITQMRSLAGLDSLEKLSTSIPQRKIKK